MNPETLVIKSHATQINALLEKGFKTTQVAEILKAELNLDISPSLIRRALSSTQ